MRRFVPLLVPALLLLASACGQSSVEPAAPADGADPAAAAAPDEKPVEQAAAHRVVYYELSKA